MATSRKTLILWLLNIGLLSALLAGCSSSSALEVTPRPVSAPAPTAASTPLIRPTATVTEASPTAAPSAPNEVIVTDSFEGVIFSQENAAASTVVYGAEAYWTPTRADILTLEEQLDAYLEQTAPQDYPGPLKRLSAYKRQYVGFVAEGKQTIFVNFFCETHGVDWHQELIFVSDGGSCYFEVSYDPQNGTFSNLSIHGEA